VKGVKVALRWARQHLQEERVQQHCVIAMSHEALSKSIGFLSFHLFLSFFARCAKQ
jgi:hypothetical protein